MPDELQPQSHLAVLATRLYSTITPTRAVSIQTRHGQHLLGPNVEIAKVLEGAATSGLLLSQMHQKHRRQLRLPIELQGC